jgi:hypothetical protein
MCGKIKIAAAKLPKQACTFEHCRVWFGILLWNIFMYFTVRKLRWRVKRMDKAQGQEMLGMRVMRYLYRQRDGVDRRKPEAVSAAVLSETSALLRKHMKSAEVVANSSTLADDFLLHHHGLNIEEAAKTVKQRLREKRRQELRARGQALEIRALVGLQLATTTLDVKVAGMHWEPGVPKLTLLKARHPNAGEKELESLTLALLGSMSQVMSSDKDKVEPAIDQGSEDKPATNGHSAERIDSSNTQYI